MAFCSKCGAQLDGDERFCANCGNDASANGTAPAAALPVRAPQPVAAAPIPYSAPAPFPAVAGVPPQAQPRSNRTLWVGIAVVVVLLGGYYYNKNHQQTPAQPPAQGQHPGATPSQPASAPAPGAPVQPGDSGPGGPNAALVQQQDFTNNERPANGYAQIFNARWTNNSNVPILRAVLECDQYDDSGAVLLQIRTNLNGTIQPGGTGSYNPFNMGAIQPNLVRVNCAIVDVTPAG